MNLGDKKDFDGKTANLPMIVQSTLAFQTNTRRKK